MELFRPTLTKCQEVVRDLLFRVASTAENLWIACNLTSGAITGQQAIDWLSKGLRKAAGVAFPPG
jgi:hypothetical protein